MSLPNIRHTWKLTRNYPNLIISICWGALSRRTEEKDCEPLHGRNTTFTYEIVLILTVKAFIPIRGGTPTPVLCEKVRVAYRGRSLILVPITVLWRKRNSFKPQRYLLGLHWKIWFKKVICPRYRYIFSGSNEPELHADWSPLGFKWNFPTSIPIFSHGSHPLQPTPWTCHIESSSSIPGLFRWSHPPPWLIYIHKKCQARKVFSPAPDWKELQWFH